MVPTQPSFQSSPIRPQTWYRLWRYAHTIEPVQVVGETPKKLTVLESFLGGAVRAVQTSKNNTYFSYYPTFEQAKTVLLARLNARVEHNLTEILNLRQAIAEVLAYPTPKES